jgi:hypothetical protein
MLENWIILALPAREPAGKRENKEVAGPRFIGKIFFNLPFKIFL